MISKRQEDWEKKNAGKVMNIWGFCNEIKQMKHKALELPTKKL